MIRAKYLTSRDRQILELAAEGVMHKQMSDILNIAPGTLKNYRAGILRKLDANNMAHAVGIYIENKNKLGGLENGAEPQGVHAKDSLD